MVGCPLCGTDNPEDASECSQCMYQLGKASFEQVATIDETQTNDLFDQLLSDFDEDEEEEVIDWSKGTFKMDDVTVDVEQYGDDTDGVKMSLNPTFAMTVDHPDPTEDDNEEYELTAADAPAFVTKFEIPESKEEILEEIPKQQINLVEPTSLVSEEDPIADEIPEEVESPDPEDQTDEEDTTDLMSLKKDELIEKAKEVGVSTSGNKADIVERIQSLSTANESLDANDDDLINSKETESSEELPPPPPLRIDMPAPPPPVAARSVDPMDAAFDGSPTSTPPSIPRIPRPPRLPHLQEEEDVISDSNDNGFWPWPQQEEWSDRDLVVKIKDAMEAAKRKENAQATVIAPTGTIGLVMDCDTTGVEPDFAMVKFKKLAGGGYFKIINRVVPEALAHLGYDADQIDDMQRYAVGAGSLKDCQAISHNALISKGFTKKEIKLIEVNNENIAKYKTLMKLYDQADIINDIV